MSERGVINNRSRGEQIRDFSGLLIPGTKITPTDIDMFIEYHNKLFIFAETKYGDADIPRGQKLALERLCDAAQRSGKESIAFITRHTAEIGEDIDMAMTVVDEYRWKYEWKKQSRDNVLHLVNAVQQFINKHENAQTRRV
jgi:uncharacterized protein YbjQ (UPF0145 family)